MKKYISPAVTGTGEEMSFLVPALLTAAAAGALTGAAVGIAKALVNGDKFSSLELEGLPACLEA